MQVQSINNNAPSFGALNIEPKVKTLIESERGGKPAIKRAIQELANTKNDLSLRFYSSPHNEDGFIPFFGGGRFGSVMPCHIKDNFVMVSSGDWGGDCEDDIVDCLKFPSTERAKEVFDKLKSFIKLNKTPLEKFQACVYGMKILEEGENIPQEKSPWAHFLEKDTDTQPVKKETPKEEAAIEPKKPSFTQRLKEAWNVLIGK